MGKHTPTRLNKAASEDAREGRQQLPRTDAVLGHLALCKLLEILQIQLRKEGVSNFLGRWKDSHLV